LALYNAVRYNYSDLQGCTMILDMGARSTNVVFVEGARFFNRSIPVAGNAITRELMKEFDLSFEDAEQLKLAHAYVGFGGTYEAGDSGVAERTSKIVRNVMTRLHAEISRTINFYRSQQGGSQPSLVLLAGGSSVIAHTNTFLKDKLKVEVDYLNPFRNAAVSDRISTEQIGKDLHLLGEVVGVALRRIHTCPVEINLMPRAMVRRKTFERRLPFFAVTAATLILGVLVWWIFFQYLQLTTAQQRLKTVQSRVQALSSADRSLNQLADQKKELYAKAGALVDLLRQRTLWPEVIETLHARLHSGMWLTSLRPLSRDEAGAAVAYLEIKGMGFTDKVRTESVSDYANALKGQGYFSDNVLVRKVKPAPGADYVIEFLIEAGLKAPGSK
jgi:type IV pilus assembly protein PilM